MLAIVIIIGLLAYGAYALIHANNQKQAREHPSAKIGDVVRDGNFSFKLTEFECNERCTASLTVTNTDDTPHHWYGDIHLYDAQQRKFSSTGKPGNMNDELNPGNSQSGAFVFEVPESLKPTAVRVYDALSDGVSIMLIN
jgi:hypothetical protein